jgi:hypothetical protein
LTGLARATVLATQVGARDDSAMTPLIWEHVKPHRPFDLDMNARLAML